MSKMDFRARLAEKMAQHPDADAAIMFDDKTICWADIRAFARRFEAALDHIGVNQLETIGVLARNRPGQAAAIMSVIASGRSISVIYTMQSAEGVARDIEQLKLPLVIGSDEDWSPEAVDAARRVGSAGLRLTSRTGLDFEMVPGLGSVRSVPQQTSPQPLTLALLSSGTTGKPKRIRFPGTVLDRMLQTMTIGIEPVPEPEITFFPLSGFGGITPFLSSIFRAGSVCLLERFALEPWLKAIDRFQPSRLVMLPAIMREVLDKQIAKERFRSVQIVWGGSAPLDPETQESFEEIYGIPVIWAYGATEFAGTAASWTPALRKEFGKSKRGSVGRPYLGVTIRIVDAATGEEMRRGEAGLLEAKVPAFGETWIRTTDLAVMDEDDFIFLKGRADQAIIRGGFKVLPETIADALLEHPAVKDAMAGGIEDRRLGQVPVAAVELSSGHDNVTAEELLAFLRTKLVAYAVPTAIHILPSLPRTSNMKANLSALAELTPR
jgi:acyl-coenzyme A synthetase/AMP-(fatty) acid ligase